MRTVRIDKARLTAVVQENRDAHRGIYEKAIEGYREMAAGWLNRQLDKAKAGDDFETYLRKPMPEDHTADYDVVLEMLRMSEDESIELTQAEFRQYVNDEWGWQQQFSQVTSAYIS